MKGNLVDIAVAFVMGGAFGKVVTSFAEGLVAPLDRHDRGRRPVKNVYTLKRPSGRRGKVTQEGCNPEIRRLPLPLSLISSLEVFVMFLVIKAINSMKKKEEALAGPLPPTSY